MLKGTFDAGTTWGSGVGEWKDGVERTIRVEVTVSPDPMYAPYVDACTSMNASIAAQLIFLVLFS